MLAELQTQLINELTSRHTLSTTAPVLKSIKSHRLSAAEQLDIYRHSMQSSLLATLSLAYPVCEKLTGSSFFNLLANNYIAQNRSMSADLNDYGHSFPHFISHYTPAAELGFLSDISQLEWYWHCAFNAADDQVTLPLLEQVAQTPESAQMDIIFRLSTSAKLITSHYPILDIWKAHQTNHDNIEPIDLRHDPQYLCIFRRDLNMHIDLLTKIEYKFLVEVQKKITLNAIVNTLTESIGKFSLDKLLIASAQNGWITTTVL